MTHEKVSMSSVYFTYPHLAVAEEGLDPRFEKRRPILNYIPKWKIGAEIGVFTGQFSELLMQVAAPTKFYAVDPRHLAFGETFPDWGVYTANGKLETGAALAAARRRLERFPQAEIVVEKSLDFLAKLDDGSLDWAYIDSTHTYDGTLSELIALAPKLSGDGVLLGDDCWCRRDNRHYGVFRAVRDFCKSSGFEIMLMDHAGQWCARRTID